MNLWHQTPKQTIATPNYQDLPKPRRNWHKWCWKHLQLGQLGLIMWLICYKTNAHRDRTFSPAGSEEAHRQSAIEMLKSAYNPTRRYKKAWHQSPKDTWNQFDKGYSTLVFGPQVTATPLRLYNENIERKSVVARFCILTVFCLIL